MHQHPVCTHTKIFKSAHALKDPLDGPENVATKDTSLKTVLTSQYMLTLREMQVLGGIVVLTAEDLLEEVQRTHHKPLKQLPWIVWSRP